MINKTIFHLATTVAVILVMAQSLAHDPSEHKNDGALPNCEAMNKSNGSKMDMKDPVMIAMQKRCMHSIHEKSEHIDTEDGREMQMRKDGREHNHTEGSSK